MAIIYDMRSGRIHTENRNETSAGETSELPEHGQPRQPELRLVADNATVKPCNAYLNHIQKLLKGL